MREGVLELPHGRLGPRTWVDAQRHDRCPGARAGFAVGSEDRVVTPPERRGIVEPRGSHRQEPGWNAVHEVAVRRGAETGRSGIDAVRRDHCAAPDGRLGVGPVGAGVGLAVRRRTRPATPWPRGRSRAIRHDLASDRRRTPLRAIRSVAMTTVHARGRVSAWPGLWRVAHAGAMHRDRATFSAAMPQPLRASASISTSRLGLIRRDTTTSVAAGRTSAKTSPWTATTASASAGIDDEHARPHDVLERRSRPP